MEEEIVKDLEFATEGEEDSAIIEMGRRTGLVGEMISRFWILLGLGAIGYPCRCTSKQLEMKDWNSEEKSGLETKIWVSFTMSFIHSYTDIQCT